jgi:hypothetical protein
LGFFVVAAPPSNSTSSYNFVIHETVGKVGSFLQAMNPTSTPAE